MSADAWAKRVETICATSAAKAARRAKKLRRRSAAAGDSEQELGIQTLALTSDLLDPWLDQIEALPKPQGRDQDATEYITSMRDVGDLLGETATAIKQNDQANGKKLVKQLKAKSVSVRGQARALGIEERNPPSALTEREESARRPARLFRSNAGATRATLSRNDPPVGGRKGRYGPASFSAPAWPAPASRT